MVEVILRFETQEERNHFMDQLSDGWGENLVELKWEGDFVDANVFDVKNIGEFWDAAND